MKGTRARSIRLKDSKKNTSEAKEMTANDKHKQLTQGLKMLIQLDIRQIC